MNEPARVFTIDQQIAAVMREIAMRERCYPKWVLEKRMLQTKSDSELGAMRAVLSTLITLKG
jgi:hypothetical protein